MNNSDSSSNINSVDKFPKINFHRQNFIQLAERVNSYLLGQKMLGSERSRVRQFLNLQWERNKVSLQYGWHIYFGFFLFFVFFSFTIAIEKNQIFQGHEFTSDENLFYDTPSHLLYEASQFTRSRGIFKMEIFKGLGKEIIGSVLSNSFRKVFPPHEVVIYAGDVCDFLMIIEEGYCEVSIIATEYLIFFFFNFYS